MPVNAHGNSSGITVRNTQNVASIIGDAGTTFTEPVSLGNAPVTSASSLPQAAYGTKDLSIGIGTTTTSTGSGGNTNVGDYSLVSCTTCSSTTSVGQGSLYFITNASGVSALGYNAGAYIAGGSTANVTPSDSLYLGALSYPLANGDTNENVIGYGAVGNGSNTTTIGGSGILETYLNGIIMATTMYSAAGIALPSCRAAHKGALAVVSDATSPAYMEAYTRHGHNYHPGHLQLQRDELFMVVALVLLDAAGGDEPPHSRLRENVAWRKKHVTTKRSKSDRFSVLTRPE